MGLFRERWENYIPPYRAVQLKRRGLTWREVGVALAHEQQRDQPYLATSVYVSVWRWRKELHGA
jgi:hypothetical protein